MILDNSSIGSLPSISDTSRIIENVLKTIFRDNYYKYVLKHSEKRYIILPPRYLHFPPILITIQEHPELSDRALFLTISRRIPIDSKEDIKKILNSLSSIMNVSVEIINRPLREGKDRESVPIHYLLLSSRIHSLALKDKTWLLLALSSIIRLDENFMSEEEKQGDESRRDFPSIEYT